MHKTLLLIKIAHDFTSNNHYSLRLLNLWVFNIISTINKQSQSVYTHFLGVYISLLKVPYKFICIFGAIQNSPFSIVQTLFDTKFRIIDPCLVFQYFQYNMVLKNVCTFFRLVSLYACCFFKITKKITEKISMIMWAHLFERYQKLLHCFACSYGVRIQTLHLITFLFFSIQYLVFINTYNDEINILSYPNPHRRIVH